MESTAIAPSVSLRGRRLTEEERYYVASQWRLMWLHFRRHRLANVGATVVGILYLIALLHGFIAPYGKLVRLGELTRMPPTRIYIHDGQRLCLPFVYGTKATVDQKTWARIFTEDRSVRYPIKLLVRGDEYSFLGLFKTSLHLFGVERPGVLAIAGTDELGRDIFSRMIYGSAISMSIGLVGVAISFILGCLIGGFSGYYGGPVDTVVQRVIEFLMSVPTIPLWMALSAAIPIGWPVEKVYFTMTIILSLAGWTGLARVVRSKILELREEEFVMAAKLAGGSDWQVIRRHLLPSLMSYLIVDMTLAIPGMVLGETALSFLGLGLTDPAVSWGVLLQAAQNVSAVVTYPWYLIPAIPVVIFVLSFNFMGDGLRDAADPYKV
jgi:peptide/nickel transport system permease protein